jgi:hypothetical protein
MIARLKGIIEEIHFGGSIMPLGIIYNINPQNPSFRPSKWPQKLKIAKNSKLPKLPENCFEPVEKGVWPPISTKISHTLTNFHMLISFLIYLFRHSLTFPKLFLLFLLVVP